MQPKVYVGISQIRIRPSVYHLAESPHHRPTVICHSILLMVHCTDVVYFFSFPAALSLWYVLISSSRLLLGLLMIVPLQFRVFFKQFFKKHNKRDYGELEAESDLPCNPGCRLNRPWAFGSATQDVFYPSSHPWHYLGTPPSRGARLQLSDKVHSREFIHFKIAISSSCQDLAAALCSCSQWTRNLFQVLGFLGVPVVTEPGC